MTVSSSVTSYGEGEPETIALTDVKTKHNYIHVTPRREVAFSADPTVVVLQGGAAQVTFTDLSDMEELGIIAWEWDLTGNGVVDSTAQHPTRVYTQPGLYTVSLCVTTSLGAMTRTKNNYIRVMAPQATASIPRTHTRKLASIPFP